MLSYKVKTLEKFNVTQGNEYLNLGRILTNFVGDVGTGTYLTITGVRKQQNCLITGQKDPTTKSMTAMPPL